MSGGSSAWLADGHILTVLQTVPQVVEGRRSALVSLLVDPPNPTYLSALRTQSLLKGAPPSTVSLEI